MYMYVAHDLIFQTAYLEVPVHYVPAVQVLKGLYHASSTEPGNVVIKVRPTCTCTCICDVETQHFKCCKESIRKESTKVNVYVYMCVYACVVA